MLGGIWPVLREKSGRHPKKVAVCDPSSMPSHGNCIVQSSTVKQHCCPRVYIVLFDLNFAPRRFKPGIKRPFVLKVLTDYGMLWAMEDAHPLIICKR
jgi:hypothetical protein